ncbi:hypothetical protein LPJ73_008853, partial [Coemansia sp. RSA 2703]
SRLTAMRTRPTLLCLPPRMSSSAAWSLASTPCTSRSAPWVVPAPRPPTLEVSPPSAPLPVPASRSVALRMLPPFPPTRPAERVVAAVAVS